MRLHFSLNDNRRQDLFLLQDEWVRQDAQCARVCEAAHKKACWRTSV